MMCDNEAEQIVNDKVMFRLEFCYAATASHPCHISIQCGYVDCGIYTDSHVAIAVPVDNPLDPDCLRSAWSDAITGAIEHFNGHQQSKILGFTS